MTDPAAGAPPPSGSRLSIGIKVASLDPTLASAWYRGLYPAVNLRRLGHNVEVFDRVGTPEELKRFAVVVMVKPGTVADLRFATAAGDLGVPLVLDLCDDVFIRGYGSGGGRETTIGRAVAGLSVAVVTTGPVLAGKLRAMVALEVPVVEIADPVENEADNAAVMAAFGRDFARTRHRRRLMKIRIALRPRQRLYTLARSLRLDGPLRRLRAQLRPRKRLEQAMGLLRAAPRAFGKARSVPLADWPRRLPGALRRRLAYLLGPMPAPTRAERPMPSAALRPAPPPPSPPPALPLPNLPPMPAAAVPAPGERRRTVIWFGIKGAAHGDFGIRNLNLVAPALAKVAAEIPLRLLVVSNGEAEFARVTAGWPFPCEYREWHRDTILGDLDAADVCVIPNSRDAFSIGKSANRHALALSRGVPVVATAIPALQGMERFMILDDWEGGLRSYLTDPARAAADVEAGRAHVRDSFAPAALARSWEALLREVVRRRSTGAANAPALPRVVGFLDLVQDLDVLLPVMTAMQADPRFAPEVCVSDRLATASPRVLRELVHRGLMPRILPRQEVIAGRTPVLDGVRAVLTAAETSHPAHRAAHALVQRAVTAGVPSFTFQHGLENIGLTYFAPDPEHPGPIRFASDRILLWGPVASLPAQVMPETRARCVSVGCPKPAMPGPVALPLPPHAGPVVAVFENLHWERYDPAYVGAFLADLAATARAFPAALFLVKPHHAARWLAKHPQALGDRPANLVLADPAQPAWEPFTASAIIASVDAVVTTPSTVALDAARAGRPVAVAGYALDLPMYEPLPILRGTEDWARFVAGLDAPDDAMAARLERFRARHLVPGDAVAAILDQVAAGMEAARTARPEPQVARGAA